MQQGKLSPNFSKRAERCRRFTCHQLLNRRLFIILSFEKTINTSPWKNNNNNNNSNNNNNNNNNNSFFHKILSKLMKLILLNVCVIIAF